VQFWVFVVIFVVAICALTWLGAVLVKKNPDTDWEKNEDHPVIGGHDF